MPKLKTNRAARKRLKISGGGKIMRNRAFKSHNLAKKTRKRKRNLGKPAVVNATDRKRVRRMLGV